MALSDEAAQKQITQMVNFILNEAKDKASEIEARALEDFNIEKLKLVQQMKEKVSDLDIRLTPGTKRPPEGSQATSVRKGYCSLCPCQQEAP